MLASSNKECGKNPPNREHRTITSDRPLHPEVSPSRKPTSEVERGHRPQESAYEWKICIC